MKASLKALVALLGVTSTLASPRSTTWTNAGRALSVRQDSQQLQDVVTWDQYSLKINGQRVMIFSGEIHPYRLPVADLYLDVFQKVKSLGFNAVSFYTFWGIVEPKRGEISWEGFRDLQPFIDAAKKAGLYLIPRPGPHINAETTGGGFPGWGVHTPGLWRTSNATYVDAYSNYIKQVGGIFAKNEITKGGPVILVQAENEYSGFTYGEDFVYEKRLLQDFRDAGITVPITTNDAWPGAHYTSVDIYGYDSYPNGFDCNNPHVWKSDAVPEWFWDAHLSINPEDPNAVYEFQGGAFEGWGGAGFDLCSVLLGPEFERVFYKNQYAMSTTIFNIYMIFGGTNWGGISHPGGYSSYDYGAAIAEDRTLREKYYELKLQANFLAASPAYLTTRPQNIGNSQGAFTGNPTLKTTQVLDVVGNKTGFYVVRQNDSSIDTVQSYTLNLNTSAGALKIPALGGSLALHGKDSKIHVVDYTAGSTEILYSTAEIFTWATVDGKDVIIVYGNAGELHEIAFKFAGSPSQAKVVSGNANLKQQNVAGSSLALQFTTTGQNVVQVGNAILYIVERSIAYQFWVVHLPGSGDFAQYSTENPIIVKGGYLIRSATVDHGTLDIRGDLNGTTSFEIIAPSALTKSITFNGDKLSLSKTAYGSITAKRAAKLPSVHLPELSKLTWKTADSLPEISSQYSDAKWTTADKTTTINPTQPNTTQVLYASDYGYHTGNIIWRAHFTATGKETGFQAHLWGGSAFGFSVWLDSTFIGSWEGDAVHADYSGTFKFPGTLKAGSNHVLTILQDHMGIETDWVSGSDSFKAPRGLVDYSFIGSNSTTVSVWKVTGNLGGEDYTDKTRGPLNEGGLYAERQGWHLPGFDDSRWAAGKPTTGINNAGVAFYRTSFDLNIPKGVDYPLAFVFSNTTSTSYYRSQIYVNGYQFGKYINSIGPQKSFPVPQGILNYNGKNTLALSLWAAGAKGAKVNSFDLQLRAQVESSINAIANQPMDPWAPRPGAY